MRRGVLLLSVNQVAKWKVTMEQMLLRVIPVSPPFYLAECLGYGSVGPPLMNSGGMAMMVHVHKMTSFQFVFILTEKCA